MLLPRATVLSRRDKDDPQSSKPDEVLILLAILIPAISLVFLIYWHKRRLKRRCEVLNGLPGYTASVGRHSSTVPPTQAFLGLLQPPNNIAAAENIQLPAYAKTKPDGEITLQMGLPPKCEPTSSV